MSIEADTTNGLAPLRVSFTSDVSDPENQRLRDQWDFNADGRVYGVAPDRTNTFTEETGAFNATLKVTDQAGARGSDWDVTIIVGHATGRGVRHSAGRRHVRLRRDAVPFEIRVTDDQPVDCSRVQVTYILGHDTHGHPLMTAVFRPHRHDPDHVRRP